MSITNAGGLTSTLTLVGLLCVAGCVGDVGLQDEVWDDDEESTRGAMFKHGPPPGAAPWSYYLTSYGGPSDSSAYKKSVACGGKRPDGKWWYSTGAWSFKCFAKLKLCAKGRCAVVKVVDNGPAGWVEAKAKGRCGGTGYIIDASPMVSKYLFGKAGLGWSDCARITVSQVPATTPTGPASASGGSTPPPSGGCHKGYKFGWEYCSKACPCGHGQGDCDSNDECKQGTKCRHNVGQKYGVASSVDVCEAASSSPSPGGCHQGKLFGWTYCSAACPCGQGQGDCDKDSHCKPGLRCTHDVGSQYGAYHTVDVCEKPSSASPWGKCSYQGKPGICQSTSKHCGGYYKSNLCPGPANIRCCLN